MCRQHAVCRPDFSLGQLILELDQETGIKQQHRATAAAAARHLGL